MATDITLADITNATTPTDGTGAFDVLMKSALIYINDQVDSGRLTQGEAGEVYSSAIQNAMQQSVQYVLQEKLQEAKVDTAKAEATLATVKTLAETIKQYGFAATLNPDGTITIGADQANGIIDEDRRLKIAQKTSTYVKGGQ